MAEMTHTPELGYGAFIRKLPLPRGFTVPTQLTFEDVVAQALTRDHLDDDVRGINASLELIRRTRGGREGWPQGPVTEEQNYADLVWHEVEFRDRSSFGYALYGSDLGYIGCCYLYPLGTRTPLTEDLLVHDVDVSWWVTPEAYARGYYQVLYAALERWVAEDFPFERPYYSNTEIPPAAA
jgi:hypothetical protein